MRERESAKRRKAPSGQSTSEDNAQSRHPTTFFTLPPIAHDSHKGGIHVQLMKFESGKKVFYCF
jgi:hypothetical protein